MCFFYLSARIKPIRKWSWGIDEPVFQEGQVHRQQSISVTGEKYVAL